MVILGIDPGYAILGYGVVFSEHEHQHAIAYGTIETPKTQQFPVRLKYIGDEISKLIEQYKPDAIVVEELFFKNNQKTAILVAEARGVVLFVASLSEAKLFEYTPLQVKQVLTGYGRAEKAQVQQMVKLLLGLPSLPKPDDAADAIAVALAHARSNSLFGKFEV
ncbi:MAG: crossover junction endodeoxyribonuclease RuvC [Christensenellaceae bacterium]|nr:crossover junction endodeoxyribonuclease RuvC [Christensenellaceae bacterium]